ncbi:MAG: hypothetical protein QM820_08105 [Minicystis sp.]
MVVPPNPHIPALMLIAFALHVGAAVLAGVGARGRAEHRPFALFLGAMAIAAAVRWVLLTWWVVPFQATFPDVPLTGGALLAAHADTALFLAWPAGIAATAVAVYLRRRPWIVAGAWAVAAIAIAAAYPSTRGDVLRRCYLAAELVALAVSFGAIGTWARLRESVTLTRACVLLLVLFEMSTLLGPWLGDPFSTWWKAQILYAMLYGGLIAIQGGSLWLRSSSRSE